MDPQKSSPRQRALEAIADCSHAPAIMREILQNEPREGRPELVPCIIWKGGLSQGRPIMRAGTKSPKNPAVIYLGQKFHSRICSTKLCVNPFHFVYLPKPPTILHHVMVFEAEAVIDEYETLEDALKGIDLPAHHVLTAWHHKRQLQLGRKLLP